MPVDFVTTYISNRKTYMNQTDDYIFKRVKEKLSHIHEEMIKLQGAIEKKIALQKVKPTQKTEQRIQNQGKTLEQLKLAQYRYEQVIKTLTPTV